MNRQAIVGIFTIVALLGLFASSSCSRTWARRAGTRSASISSRRPACTRARWCTRAASCVGVVDQTILLPEDFTVDVILAINNNVDVPRNARFLIQAPLTGDSTLEIVPAVPAPQPSGRRAPTNAPAAVAVLPREILPIEQQPQGTNPATIQDLLDQGQGEVRRLDSMLAHLANREPALLDTLQSALNNANDAQRRRRTGRSRGSPRASTR